MYLLWISSIYLLQKSMLCNVVDSINISFVDIHVMYCGYHQCNIYFKK